MNDPGGYRVRLEPELLDDVAEVYAWYETQDKGLGREFTNVLDTVIAAVALQPTLHRLTCADYRRAFLHRFRIGFTILSKSGT